MRLVIHPDRQDEKGYFGDNDGSRMYGQGIITLMLAETLGMGIDDKQDATIRRRLQKGVELILRAQAVTKSDKSHEGGWRCSACQSTTTTCQYTKDSRPGASFYL